jgi:hypothetical protein
MTFEELDCRLITAPRNMDDDAFARLLADWLRAAGDIIATPATGRLDLASKLRTVARVCEELDGTEIGAREIGMVQAIAADAKRLAAVQARERRRLRKLILGDELPA